MGRLLSFLDKAVKGLLIIALAVAGIYVLRSKNLFVQSCNRPITYKLGTFDTQFGLSQTQFLQDIDKAVNIWDTPVHKTLFQYDQKNGELVINLVYDQRQQATDQLAKLGIKITDDKSSYNLLKQKYQTMKAQYDTQKAQLDSLVRSYQIQKSSYDQEVQYWNSRGGAPKGTYTQLDAQRQELNAAADQINQQQAAVNTLATNINAIVDALNSLGSELNLNVTDYNKIGAQTGQEFEEGNYKSDASGQEIDIYQFNSQDKLTRVLAHELGHALGLDHVNDPQAIMYRLNQGQNQSLTQADLSELKQKCNLK